MFPAHNVAQLQMRFLFAIAVCALAFLAGCHRQSNAVSGTIEVDEVHVASRSAGRVEKIFAWEGDALKTGAVIVQLEASEMQARRSLAAAQINTAQHDV